MSPCTIKSHSVATFSLISMSSYFSGQSFSHYPRNIVAPSSSFIDQSSRPASTRIGCHNFLYPSGTSHSQFHSCNLHFSLVPLMTPVTILFSLFSQLSFFSVFFLFSLSGWLPCPGFLSLSSAVRGWLLGSLFAGHGRTFPPCPGLLSTFGRSLALASPYTTIFQDSFFAINQIRGRKRTGRNLSWDSLRHQSQRPEGICDSCR
jgi:hypothetical protein